MKMIDFNFRKLIMFSFEELDNLPLLDEEFSIFIHAEENINNIFSKIAKKIIIYNCKEICLFGDKSEEYHDFFDEKIEDKELFNIVTTSFTDETEGEALEYFINISGSKPPILLVCIENMKLRNIILNKLNKSSIG